MSGLVERVDRTLGRLIFRAVGIFCATVTLICAWQVWSHLADWQEGYWVPVILFAVVAVAAGSAVPYCFSQKRTLGEALDAMEGGAGDTNRPTPPKKSR